MGIPRAGKRRFKRFGLSLRKGTAKTELAAAVAYAELHPDGPVRCDGWRQEAGAWVPVGRPVTDPYVPMVAYTEEQTEDLAYAALYVMVTEGPDAGLFDAGLERILRLDDRGRADGKAVALASSPDARDGARTTFQHFDETHRFTLPRLVEAHETMLQNVPKRMGADAWSLETTTTYTPGEGSVAEATHEEAEQVAKGKVQERHVLVHPPGGDPAGRGEPGRPGAVAGGDPGGVGARRGVVGGLRRPGGVDRGPVLSRRSAAGTPPTSSGCG
jgi:hypothetical protein